MPSWNELILGAAVAGLALAAAPGVRRRVGLELRAFLLLVASGVCWATFAGVTDWVERNGYGWRYLIPSQLLFHSAAFLLLAGPLLAVLEESSPRVRARAGQLAAGLLTATSLAVWGLPSARGVRSDLAPLVGPRAEAILASGCQAVAGSYWSVWPDVFGVELLRGDGAPGGRVYGFTHRALPTYPAWAEARAAGPTICVPADDRDRAEAAHYFSSWGWPPMAPVARLGEVDLYRPVSRATPQPPAPRAAGAAR
jgi:hypothetical protein